MESIKTIIREAVKNLKSANDFRDLAEKIIRNYHIKCGEKTYRFSEIEFYYYDKEKFNDEWNWKTYARTDKEAGELFFHYSGVDICFDSSFDKGFFGGILIRSLFDETNKLYITGPLLCANEILNSCSSSGGWPQIEKTEEYHCEIEAIGRYGINYSVGYDFKDNLCYYDKKLEGNPKDTIERTTWDYANPGLRKNKRYYSKRFLNESK